MALLVSGELCMFYFGVTSWNIGVTNVAVCTGVTISNIGVTNVTVCMYWGDQLLSLG